MTTDPTHPARRTTRRWAPDRPRFHARARDRGEGVISAAIAVLIMAGLGALMWVGFGQMWEETRANTDRQIQQIGAP